MSCVNYLTLLGGAGDDSGSVIWAAHYLGEMAKAIIDDAANGIFRADDKA